MLLKFHLGKLQASVTPDYCAALLAAGTTDGNVLRIESEAVIAIRKRFEPERKPAPPVKHIEARDQWPVWAKGVSYFAGSNDRGVGDTIARHVGTFGGEAFKRWYAETFKSPCKCSERQAKWNDQFPYSAGL